MFLLLFTFSFLEVAMSARLNSFVYLEISLCFSLEFHFESQSAHCHCPPVILTTPCIWDSRCCQHPRFMLKNPKHSHPLMRRALTPPSKHFAKKEFLSLPKGVSDGICILRINARISTNKF